MENPRFKNDELGTLTEPDEKNLPCVSCALREKDRMDGAIKGATLGICQAYSVKPEDILWNGLPCPFYEKEQTT